MHSFNCKHICKKIRTSFRHFSQRTGLFTGFVNAVRLSHPNAPGHSSLFFQKLPGCGRIRNLKKRNRQARVRPCSVQKHSDNCAFCRKVRVGRDRLLSAVCKAENALRSPVPVPCLSGLTPDTQDTPLRYLVYYIRSDPKKQVLSQNFFRHRKILCAVPRLLCDDTICRGCAFWAATYMVFGLS